MRQKALDFGGDPAPSPGPARRRHWSVAALTERLRGVLETEFFDVWVEGEVSNLNLAASGHWYFSLKDEQAQIRAVVWRSTARMQRFKPRDGMKVLVRGGVKVYPPKGEYQLAVELLEPLGKGALQAAFEDLKRRLEGEGLFARERKRALPLLPRRIGLVTSPQGAVLRDILRVLRRRYPNVELLLYPARVQGPEAAGEIAQGIAAMNRVPGVDVLIVARGGGSLEDLWPFNEERVARALAASRLPTISAVGHDTDYTIADFVADLRAPTPSAAAEMVVRAKVDLQAHLAGLDKQREAALGRRLQQVRARVHALRAHRVFAAEQGRVQRHAQRVDELRLRAERGLLLALDRERERLRRGAMRLEAFRLERQLAERRQRLDDVASRLVARARRAGEPWRARLAHAAGRLESLSPLAVLARGYALAFDERGRLVRSPDDAHIGQELRLRVQGGGLRVGVLAKEQP
jgi:exodeoxyribonuclease VII large subunit